MKKIKILLPLASVCTLAGTITPLMTSCGSSATQDTIPEDRLWIEENTLMGLKVGASIDGYTTLAIPEGVKIINDEAFKDVFTGDNCKVTKIIFPNTITQIRNSAFYGCDTINELDFSSFDDVDQVYGLQTGAEILDENASKRFGTVHFTSSTEKANKELIRKLKAAGTPEAWLYSATDNNVSIAQAEVTALNANASFSLDFGTSLPLGGSVSTLLVKTGGTDNTTVELGDVVVDQSSNSITSTGTMSAKIAKTDGTTLSDGDFVKFNLQLIAHDALGGFAWKQIINDVSVTYQWREIAASELVISGKTTLSTSDVDIKYTASVVDPVHEKLYSDIKWSIESQTYAEGASIDADTGELTILKHDFDNTISILASAKTLDDKDVYGRLDVAVVSPNMQFVFAEAGTFTVTVNQFSPYTQYSYSLDGSKFIEIPLGETTAIEVQKGSKLAFKGCLTIPSYARTPRGILKRYFAFESTAKYSVCGSVMGLLDNGGEYDNVTLWEGCFYSLFSESDAENHYLTGVSKTFLSKVDAIPANGFESMFETCTNLTSAPDIAAKSCGKYGCSGMFAKCANLTTAPSISCTKLDENCFEYMFYGCEKLVNLPDSLPAKTVPAYAYQYMFNACTALKTIPENFLPATTVYNHCYYSMFYECSALTTAMKTLPAKLVYYSTYACMFQDCTNLTSAPEILVSNYDSDENFAYMFENCSKLAYVSLPNFQSRLDSYNFQSFLDGTAAAGLLNIPSGYLSSDDYTVIFGDSYSYNWIINQDEDW